MLTGITIGICAGVSGTAPAKASACKKAIAKIFLFIEILSTLGIILLGCLIQQNALPNWLEFFQGRMQLAYTMIGVGFALIVVPYLAFLGASASQVLSSAPISQK